MTEIVVRSGPVPIAVADDGGDAPPMVMLHGGGGNLATMVRLARALRPAYRIIRPDLRGHGRSGSGPWDWEAVLDDLDAVVKELGLDNPPVVGLSLGGMLAAMWARRHPGCAGAVSLDGNPPPSRPDQLVGLDPATATAELARLRAVFDGMAAAMAGPWDADQLAAARAAQQHLVERFGGPAEDWLSAFDRNVEERDGVTWPRPDADLVAQLDAAMAELDPLPVYADVRCPLLLVLATEDLPEQRPFRDLYAAYRRYLGTRLAALEPRRGLRVEYRAGASHAMAAEDPVGLAGLIVEFLAHPHRHRPASSI
ncbi:alpha/beta fold hydrolase [Plantactinospora sp. GCM10030261]|uniref:alpha/beta fold hydrolase n=1 Tax=Plantactinospora sp. GCM10030261 TaxID=3273420 RepID=UPI003606898C